MKKSDFKVLGTITHMATNGLMVFSNGKSTGQISDGKIGDVVVRAKDETGLEAQIFSAEEWASMGADEKKSGKDEDGKKDDAKANEDLSNLGGKASKEGE
ncbi:hypothetical protein [uncultured Campylobacter sp.]|mgnify:CR=1 FL=1|uniref:hypothetical protein n=1 Tax=uncultured Campylobacter sp. TaxID=218934 RepID=UPI0026141C7E|nr:hypothetical protein [uncultured Campylobacter sp.]